MAMSTVSAVMVRWVMIHQEFVMILFPLFLFANCVLFGFRFLYPSLFAKKWFGWVTVFTLNVLITMTMLQWREIFDGITSFLSGS